MSFNLNKIFVDLDGVLADFDKSVIEITGKLPSEQKVSHMWKALSSADDFYYNLDLLPGAYTLWSYVKKYNPIILTGLPLGNWAENQKRRWVKKYFGASVPVITCMSKDKPMAAKNFINSDTLKNCILIDDRKKAQPLWENENGVFILHTSISSTLNKLKELKI